MRSHPILIAALVAAAGSAAAQTQAIDHAPHHSSAEASAASAANGELADGEVRKVDKEAGKLTLRHGPIKSLDMPGMTMVFRVADPKMLDALTQGDTVRFSVDRVNGALTITRIEAVK